MYDISFNLFRNPGDFWMTTGLYPQELTLAFNSAKVITEVSFVTTGAKKIVIEGCATSNGNAFKTVGESQEINWMNGGLQKQTVRLQGAGPQILVKFIIQDGWEDFTSVHSVECS